MVRNLIAALLFLGLATVVWADFEKGFAAYKRGDYATALKEFRKSAERGNASAQSISVSCIAEAGVSRRTTPRR